MKKRCKQTKQEWLAIHARERCQERYGFDGNACIRRQAIAQITGRRPTGTHIQTRTTRVSEWLVWVIPDGGEWTVARVLYDKNRHAIATFLPPFKEEEPAP